MTDMEKLQRFDQEMRKRFGVKWAPPVPVPPEDEDPAADSRRKLAEKALKRAEESLQRECENREQQTRELEKALRFEKAAMDRSSRYEEPERSRPNRKENELMLNLMILRNALVAYGPAARERAKRAGPTVWRDIRLLTVLVEKVQTALLRTMPQRRDKYYTAYAQHGHYELAMNGPIRGKRLVLISDKYLGAVCEAAMENECLMCIREGNEIGGCLLRQALLEVAAPTEIQDGKWKKCEYRDAAGKLIHGEEVNV